MLEDRVKFVEFLSVWAKQEKNQDPPVSDLWYSFGKDIWVAPKSIETQKLLEEFSQMARATRVMGFQKQKWKDSVFVFENPNKALSFLILVLKVARDSGKANCAKIKYSEQGWLYIDTAEATFLFKTKEVVEDDLV